MKLITIFMAGGLIFAASAQTDANRNTKSATNKVTKVPESPTIPKDATPLPDGSYRYVDKDGKKWIYRATPFGVSKSEEHPPAPQVKVEDDPAKSEDLGDSVRFTRPTPFGAKVWTRKKTELDSYEKTIFERDQQTNASAHNSAKKD
jgi:hypothetical protein